MSKNNLSKTIFEKEKLTNNHFELKSKEDTFKDALKRARHENELDNKELNRYIDLYKENLGLSDALSHSYGLNIINSVDKIEICKNMSSFETSKALDNFFNFFKVGDEYNEMRSAEQFSLRSGNTDRLIKEGKQESAHQNLKKQRDKEFLFKEKLFLNTSLITNKLNKKQKDIFYNIGDYPNMFMELGKINPFETKQIINFINTFGLFYDVRPDIEEDELLKKVNLKVEYLPRIVLDLIKYKMVVTAFLEVVQRPNNENLQILLDLFNFFARYKQQLQLFNGSVIAGASTKNIFEIAYFQMHNALIYEYDFRKCNFCDNYFVINHYSQRFCPPLPGRKRSSCEMAHHRKLKKERNDKIHGNG